MASTMGDPHVAQIYSPPRVTSLAEKFGLKAGFALDLTVNNDQGVPWNFDDPEMRKEAKRLVETLRPVLLIGSPMCRAFSCLQGLNRSKMSPEKWKALWEHGLSHLLFMCEIYKIQADSGKFILHEHPASASSWKIPEIVS